MITKFKIYENSKSYNDFKISDVIEIYTGVPKNTITYGKIINISPNIEYASSTFHPACYKISYLDPENSYMFEFMPYIRLDQIIKKLTPKEYKKLSIKFDAGKYNL